MGEFEVQMLLCVCVNILRYEYNLSARFAFIQPEAEQAPCATGSREEQHKAGSDKPL